MATRLARRTTLVLSVLKRYRVPLRRTLEFYLFIVGAVWEMDGGQKGQEGQVGEVDLDWSAAIGLLNWA